MMERLTDVKMRHVKEWAQWKLGSSTPSILAEHEDIARALLQLAADNAELRTDRASEDAKTEELLAKWVAVNRENAELRRVLRDAAEAMERACEHRAPEDCYATGPLTGNAYRDLVQCPGCVAVDMAKDIRRLLSGEVQE